MASSYNGMSTPCVARHQPIGRVQSHVSPASFSIDAVTPVSDANLWRAGPMQLLNARLQPMSMLPPPGLDFDASDSDHDLPREQETGAKKKKKSRGRINFDEAVKHLEGIQGSRILRIGGLLKFGDMAEIYLNEYLSKFGPLSSIHTVTCSPGSQEVPSGIAFVVMERQEDVSKVLRISEHEMPQGHINVRKFAHSKKKQSSRAEPPPEPAAASSSTLSTSKGLQPSHSTATTLKDHIVSHAEGITVFRF